MSMEHHSAAPLSSAHAAPTSIERERVNLSPAAAEADPAAPAPNAPLPSLYPVAVLRAAIPAQRPMDEEKKDDPSQEEPEKSPGVEEHVSLLFVYAQAYILSGGEGDKKKYWERYTHPDTTLSQKQQLFSKLLRINIGEGGLLDLLVLHAFSDILYLPEILDKDKPLMTYVLGLDLKILFPMDDLLTPLNAIAEEANVHKMLKDPNIPDDKKQEARNRLEESGLNQLLRESNIPDYVKQQVLDHYIDISLPNMPLHPQSFIAQEMGFYIRQAIYARLTGGDATSDVFREARLKALSSLENCPIPKRKTRIEGLEELRAHLTSSLENYLTHDPTPERKVRIKALSAYLAELKQQQTHLPHRFREHLNMALLRYDGMKAMAVIESLMGSALGVPAQPFPSHARSPRSSPSQSASSEPATPVCFKVEIEVEDEKQSLEISLQEKKMPADGSSGFRALAEILGCNSESDPTAIPIRQQFIEWLLAHKHDAQVKGSLLPEMVAELKGEDHPAQSEDPLAARAAGFCRASRVSLWNKRQAAIYHIRTRVRPIPLRPWLPESELIALIKNAPQDYPEDQDDLAEYERARPDPSAIEAFCAQPEVIEEYIHGFARDRRLGVHTAILFVQYKDKDLALTVLVDDPLVKNKKRVLWTLPLEERRAGLEETYLLFDGKDHFDIAVLPPAPIHEAAAVAVPPEPRSEFATPLEEKEREEKEAASSIPPSASEAESLVIEEAIQSSLLTLEEDALRRSAAESIAEISDVSASAPSSASEAAAVAILPTSAAEFAAAFEEKEAASSLPPSASEAEFLVIEKVIRLSRLTAERDALVILQQKGCMQSSIEKRLDEVIAQIAIFEPSQAVHSSAFRARVSDTSASTPPLTNEAAAVDIPPTPILEAVEEKEDEKEATADISAAIHTTSFSSLPLSAFEEEFFVVENVIQLSILTAERDLLLHFKRQGYLHHNLEERLEEVTAEIASVEYSQFTAERDALLDLKRKGYVHSHVEQKLAEVTAKIAALEPSQTMHSLTFRMGRAAEITDISASTPLLENEAAAGAVPPISEPASAEALPEQKEEKHTDPALYWQMQEDTAACAENMQHSYYVSHHMDPHESGFEIFEITRQQLLTALLTTLHEDTLFQTPSHEELCNVLFVVYKKCLLDGQLDELATRPVLALKDNYLKKSRDKEENQAAYLEAETALTKHCQDQRNLSTFIQWHIGRNGPLPLEIAQWYLKKHNKICVLLEEKGAGEKRRRHFVVRSAAANTKEKHFFLYGEGDTENYALLAWKENYHPSKEKMQLLSMALYVTCLRYLYLNVSQGPQSENSLETRRLLYFLKEVQKTENADAIFSNLRKLLDHPVFFENGKPSVIGSKHVMLLHLFKTHAPEMYKKCIVVPKENHGVHAYAFDIDVQHVSWKVGEDIDAFLATAHAAAKQYEQQYKQLFQDWKKLNASRQEEKASLKSAWFRTRCEEKIKAIGNAIGKVEEDIKALTEHCISDVVPIGMKNVQQFNALLRMQVRFEALNAEQKWVRRQIFGSGYTSNKLKEKYREAIRRPSMGEDHAVLCEEIDPSGIQQRGITDKAVTALKSVDQAYMRGVERRVVDIPAVDLGEVLEYKKYKRNKEASLHLRQSLLNRFQTIFYGKALLLLADAKYLAELQSESAEPAIRLENLKDGVLFLASMFAPMRPPQVKKGDDGSPVAIAELGKELGHYLQEQLELIEPADHPEFAEFLVGRVLAYVHRGGGLNLSGLLDWLDGEYTFYEKSAAHAGPKISLTTRKKQVTCGALLQLSGYRCNLRGREMRYTLRTSQDPSQKPESELYGCKTIITGQQLINLGEALRRGYAHDTWNEETDQSCWIDQNTLASTQYEDLHDYEVIPRDVVPGKANDEKSEVSVLRKELAEVKENAERFKQQAEQEKAVLQQQQAATELAVAVERSAREEELATLRQQLAEQKEESDRKIAESDRAIEAERIARGQQEAESHRRIAALEVARATDEQMNKAAIKAMEQRFLEMLGQQQKQNTAPHENTVLPATVAADLSLPPAQPTEEKEPAPSAANTRVVLGAGSAVTFLPPLPRTARGQSAPRVGMEVVRDVSIEAEATPAAASVFPPEAPQN